MDCLFQLSEEVLMERAARFDNYLSSTAVCKSPARFAPQTATQAQTRNGDCVHLRR
jgi:hypothetical protein